MDNETNFIIMFEVKENNIMYYVIAKKKERNIYIWLDEKIWG